MWSQAREKEKSRLLLRGRCVGELDALLDVALEALDGSLQKGVLLVGNVLEGVESLLGAVGLYDNIASARFPSASEKR